MLCATVEDDCGCHTYVPVKPPGGAGNPDPTEDLAILAPMHGPIDLQDWMNDVKERQDRLRALPTDF